MICRGICENNPGLYEEKELEWMEKMMTLLTGSMNSISKPWFF